MPVYYNGSLCNVMGGGREAYQILINNQKVWNYEFIGDGNWTACSATCGGGVQYQGAICKRSDGITKSQEFCNNDGIPTPTLSRTCNTHSCATIDTGSTCDVSSGGTVTSGDGGEIYCRSTCWGSRNVAGYITIPVTRGTYIYFSFTFTWYDVRQNMRMLLTSPGGASAYMTPLCVHKVSGSLQDFRIEDSQTVLLGAADGREGRGRVLWRAPLSWVGNQNGNGYGQVLFTWYYCDLRDYSGNLIHLRSSQMAII